MFLEVVRNFKLSSYIKFEVFTVVKIDIMIFWAVTPCSRGNEHWWYEVKCSIFRVEASQLEKLAACLWGGQQVIEEWSITCWILSILI
jgi:hypothetical protein